MGATPALQPPGGGGPLSPVTGSTAARRGRCSPRGRESCADPGAEDTQDPGCRSQRPAYPGSAAPRTWRLPPRRPRAGGFLREPPQTSRQGERPARGPPGTSVPRRSRPSAHAPPRKPGGTAAARRSGKGGAAGSGRNGRRGRGGGGGGGGGAGGGGAGEGRKNGRGGGGRGEGGEGAGRDARLPWPLPPGGSVADASGTAPSRHRRLLPGGPSPSPHRRAPLLREGELCAAVTPPRRRGWARVGGAAGAST